MVRYTAFRFAAEYFSAEQLSSMTTKFFKMRQEWFLGGVAAIIIAFLVAVFVWGITHLGFDLEKSVSPDRKQDSGLNFDLDGAKRLDLKGLAQ